MIPSPSEIRYFIEAYQTKHFTRSALRLGITQPTLTQAIQNLEHKLGSPLFIRSKQGVIPTKAAVQFYAQVLKLNECWEEIKNEMDRSNQELEGVFTVGCHQSVAAYTIPGFLKRIDEEAPKVSVRLVHDFSRKITDKIVNYELDLGFVVNPFKHPDLVFKKLGDDRVTFWSKKGLSKIPKRIFADGHREQVEKLLGATFKSHFHDWKIVDSTSLEVIRTLTLSGLGVGVLPERVAKVEGDQLEIYDRSLPVRPDEIYLAYRKEMMSSNTAKEVLRMASVKI